VCDGELQVAWIESHQALAHHPKTLRLAAELKCGIPASIGYVHLLWYWCLDYAHDGVVDVSMRDQVEGACYWRGKAGVLWNAFVQAGFVEVIESGVQVHDWMDYAGRLIQKRAANVDRVRNMRARNAEQIAQRYANQQPQNAQRNAQATRDVTGLPTNQPTGEGIKPSPSPTPPNPQSAAADAQGPSGTASALSQSQAPPPTWEEIAPGQHRGTPNGQGEISLLTARCPRCERSMPVSDVENHLCELVVGEPVQTPPSRRRGRGLRRVFEDPSNLPPEVREDLARMTPTGVSPEQLAATITRLGQPPHD
jgi:hypothetical protein